MIYPSLQSTSAKMTGLLAWNYKVEFTEGEREREPIVFLNKSYIEMQSHFSNQFGDTSIMFHGRYSICNTDLSIINIPWQGKQSKQFAYFKHIIFAFQFLMMTKSNFQSKGNKFMEELPWNPLYNSS